MNDIETDGSRYYLLRGKTPVPCTLSEWLENFGNIDVVARDTIGTLTVSTVFLGMNHHWRNYGAPLLFETMIFDESVSGRRWRYSTYEEAEKMHRQIADAIRRNCAVPD